MKSKKRVAVITVILSAATIIGFGIFGACKVPSGINIAAAIIIALSLLVETPLTAMALAKHKHK